MGDIRSSLEFDSGGGETMPLIPSKKDADMAKTEGRRLVRNIFVIAISFMVFFTASSSIGQLQSSINPDAGLGVYSRAAGYGAMLFSSLFLPTFFMKKYSVKMTLIFSMLGITMYIGAQFYPKFSTLIPTGIVMGLSAAPLWSAKSTYITMVAQKYADLENGKAELIMGRFFGIFSLLFQTSKIWGNILSAVILSIGESRYFEESAFDFKNTSFCGVQFCPANAEESNVLLQPPRENLIILLTIYTVLAFVGVAVLAVFLDPLQRTDESLKESSLSSSRSVNPLTATFYQMVKPFQLLIMPLTLWSGLEQGYFVADFTQAYVTCSWGVEKLGYVIICYAVCNALSSICLDPIVRRIGRLPVFITAAILNFSMICTMFKWHPDSSQPTMFFAVAGVWGIADSIWHTQLKGFYGSLFQGNEEAAFSNYTLWESLGFVIAFVNGDLLCVNLKLFSLIGVLSFGMIGYVTIEISAYLKKAMDVI